MNIMDSNLKLIVKEDDEIDEWEAEIEKADQVRKMSSSAS